MHRELRFGVITIQNVQWQTLAEHWQYLDEPGFDSAARLREFTEIEDQMLRNEETTYRGRYYEVQNANMRLLDLHPL